MSERFDLVVIGTGSAAANVASRCRDSGWSVAVVDHLSFGGTCALRGCDPKRVLVGAAEAVEGVRRFSGSGISAREVAIHWPELERFKRSFTDPVPARREAAFEKAGIRALHGRARFVAPTELRVGDDRLAARHIVIASGARPAALGIEGERHLTTSDAFLELERLPERIVFVGGGFISFEFAHVAMRAGARVTLVHRGGRPLAGFDPDLVRALVERTRALGVEVVLDAPVRAIEREPDGFAVHAEVEGAPWTARADLVVHGAGRVPDLDGLDLEAGRVARGPGGVLVDAHLRSTTNPAVHAAGDCADTEAPPLTPVAGYEGRVVAENLIEGDTRTPDYRGVASVVFTVPPLAATGLLEEQARAQGLAFRVHHQLTGDWYSSRRLGEWASGFKVLIEEGSERILGAHLLGPGVEELINVFALAIRADLKASFVREAFFAYPTHGSDLPYML